MEKIYPLRNSLRACVVCACALALALCALAQPTAVRAATPTRPSLSRQQQQAGARVGTPSDDDDGGDEQDDSKPRVRDPATIMRRARFVYVSSDSAFVNAHEVEDSLRKRKEFQAWGMIVTRNIGEADLVLEITRKAFTRRFTFTVVDPRTNEVVASGKMRSVLFGKKIPNKVAEQFANRVKVYRPYP